MKRFYGNKALFISSLWISLSFLAGWPVKSAFAQQPPPSPLSRLDSSLQFMPPVLPDRGRPRGRSSGGASRGSCDTTGQFPLTALVPVTPIEIEGTSSAAAEAELPTYDSVFSFTSRANPTFWFYVPYALSETPVEFVLQDEQNNTLYQTRLSSDDMTASMSAPVESGVVGITLPEAEVALQTGALYHWYFMAYCDESSPAFVEGWTERTALDASLSADLENATAKEQVALYARHGIWQEAITLLGEQYRADPNSVELVQDWVSLLDSVSLGEIAQQPLTDCCTP